MALTVNLVLGEFSFDLVLDLAESQDVVRRYQRHRHAAAARACRSAHPDNSKILSNN